jgi:dienelactone hydrolase
MRRLLLVTTLIALASPPACGEIQTLFRGMCFTEEEGAAKLDRYAAEFDTKEGWEARAKKIRTGILKGARLEKLPAKCELKPIRRDPKQGDGYVVENVAFESLPGFWVTGNLYLPAQFVADEAEPNSKGEAFPGMLSPQGHGEGQRLSRDTQARCAALARMGVVVFTYDMVGINESTPVAHKNGETMRLQTYNSMRGIDFLISLGVDPDRIGITGYSGGGTQSFLLAAVDPRVALSAPACQISCHFYGGCVCESGLPIHKDANHETDNVEIAASFAPKPQLVISDGKDWTLNVDKVEFPYIQRVYELMGAKDMTENAHFPEEGHDYGPSKRKAMYAFVAKHFGLDLKPIQNDAGEIDESWFKPYESEQLLVFTDDAPRPDYAIKNSDEVIRKLDGG